MLIGPFAQVVTMDNLPLKGKLSDSELEVLGGGQWILLEDELISTIGPYKRLKKDAESLDLEIVHLTRGAVCLPGFIDCHTHICYGGSRANDYAARNNGLSYLEIAEQGGGIWDTVTQTRKATAKSLEHDTIIRAERHLAEGVTTMEVKSGYGLSVNEELKMLRAIANANQKTQADLISTCLAAHILPKDFQGTQQEYLCKIHQELLPKVLSQNLSKRVDIFIEKGAFDRTNSLDYLNKAKGLGFDFTIHADQFSTGGSKLAVEIGAVSADHLEASKGRDIERLAKSDVVAVALPGASLGLGMAFAPARKLLDAGACLAIASDWNPGSAPMGDLLIQAAVLGASEKLSNAEVLAGITYRAAATLSLADRGKICKGFLADLAIFPCQHFNEILYHQGKLKPHKIVKKGKLLEAI